MSWQCRETLCCEIDVVVRSSVCRPLPRLRAKMASRVGLTRLTGLLLLASAAALLPPRYSLRNENPPSFCGFAEYGSAVGTAQRLVETHLTPGVADWNIVVPMPPPCVGEPMMGVDMRVCDSDSPPNVTLSDMRSARVHRPGQLAGFATVNVTVYCIITPTTAPLPAPTPPYGSRSDPMSAYELSNEQNSDEMASNNDSSDELEWSTELTTTINLISTTTLPPVQEESTVRNKLILPTKEVPHEPILTANPKEKTPQSLKVTININPSSRVSTEEDNQSLLSNKEKSNKVMSSHSPRLSLEPYIVAPPRMSGMPPRTRITRPRWPAPAQYPVPGALDLPPYPAPYPLSPYPLESPYALSAFYRPQNLLNSRLRFLQRRHPLLFYRHY